VQYDIGNPNTASKMTRDQLAAAQYAPFRVVLYESSQDQAIFEYDKPSSLFGQFGDAKVNAVARPSRWPWRVGGETPFLCIAEMVGFGMGKSKMSYFS
jgi:hypothetical protein